METHEITVAPATSWPGFLSSWLRRPDPDQPASHAAPDATDAADREDPIEEYLSTWPRVFPGL